MHFPALVRASTALSILVLTITGAAAQNVADKIYTGGPVITIDDAAPRAEAVAVKDGRIIAVGKTDDVMKHRGDATEMVDLAGRTMIPGFVDAHGHAIGIGLQALSANLLPAPDGPGNSIKAIQDALTSWADANDGRVKAVNLIIGFGYDEPQLAEQRAPTRDDLDAVSTETPVMVIHQSGHLAAVNSKALEVIGLTSESENPPGGVIRRRDGSKDPNGVLEETAFFVAFEKLIGNLDPKAASTIFKAGIDLSISYGYTTVQEGRASPPIVNVIQATAAQERLKADVVAYADVLIDRDFIKANASQTYDNRFRLGGGKLTIDGSPQGFTAWRDRPYFDPPETYRADYRGYTAATPDQVFNAVDWAFANDVQILVHSNGEASHDLLIAAMRAATRAHGNVDRRPVLIHGQFLREDQVDAFNSLKVFPSLFPMHTFYWGDWHRDRTVGPVLAENISPTGWVRARGMRFSSHHDAPVAFPDSMRILDATVTRRTRSGDILGPQHRVDVDTALKAMTIWPAYQHFEEDQKGSIEVGKLADLVVLSDDPTAVDPETLDQLKVQLTIKEGETIYDASATGQRRGNLRLKPRRDGEGVFQRFLRRAAVDAETRHLGTDGLASLRRAWARNNPHPGVCVHTYLTRTLDVALAKAN